MSGQALDQAVDEAARLIFAANYVVALVGAGLSVESDIPPFRGPGGLWTKYGEPDMRGYDRFLDDPKQWWEERISRTGSYQELGSRAITEIHGNRTKLRCLGCGRRWPLDQFAIDELPPTCPDCGGIVKSDTVMFGEPIPRDALDECLLQTEMCDCMLLVGTSAVVYPAAGFPVDVKRNGGRLIEVNPNETPLTDMSDIVLRAPAGRSLPIVMSRLREMAGAR